MLSKVGRREKGGGCSEAELSLKNAKSIKWFVLNNIYQISKEGREVSEISQRSYQVSKKTIS